MPSLEHVLIFTSSLSFLGYGSAYFLYPHIKSEFKRFGLEKYGQLIATLEILGAVGLWVGLSIHTILLISSGGLAMLMLLGFGVRLKIRDSFWVSSPALLFLVINSALFCLSVFKH